MVLFSIVYRTIVEGHFNMMDPPNTADPDLLQEYNEAMNQMYDKHFDTHSCHSCYQIGMLVFLYHVNHDEFCLCTSWKQMIDIYNTMQMHCRLIDNNLGDISYGDYNCLCGHDIKYQYIFTWDGVRFGMLGSQCIMICEITQIVSDFTGTILRVVCERCGKDKPRHNGTEFCKNCTTKNETEKAAARLLEITKEANRLASEEMLAKQQAREAAAAIVRAAAAEVERLRLEQVAIDRAAAAEVERLRLEQELLDRAAEVERTTRKCINECCGRIPRSEPSWKKTCLPCFKKCAAPMFCSSGCGVKVVFGRPMCMSCFKNPTKKHKS